MTMKYKTAGSVSFSNNFILIYKLFKFLSISNKKCVQKFLYNSITQAKIADVQTLMKHLSLCDQSWLERILNEPNNDK